MYILEMHLILSLDKTKLKLTNHLIILKNNHLLSPIHFLEAYQNIHTSAFPLMHM